MAGPTNRESDKFMLRLPEGMREQIKAAAEGNSRSMNAEIVARLEASFATTWEGLPDALYDRIAEFEQSMRSEFSQMRKQIQEEQLMRAKAEDRLLQERLKE